MSLMWFFNITLVVNEVLLSVQNLKDSSSEQKSQPPRWNVDIHRVPVAQSTYQQVYVLFFPSWVVRLCLLRPFLELKDCSQCRHGYFFTDC